MASDKIFVSGFVLGAIFSYTGLLGFLAGVATGIVVMNYNSKDPVVQVRTETIQSYGIMILDKIKNFSRL
jgi:hypothetical protein